MCCFLEQQQLLLFIVLSRASNMLVVLLANPFRDCHCWLLLVRVLLLLCCWIPLMVVKFHLGVAFSSSSSTWNASTSRAGISTPSSTTSTRPLSNPLPTPCQLSRPLPTPCRTSPLSIVRTSVLCVSRLPLPLSDCVPVVVVAAVVVFRLHLE